MKGFPLLLLLLAPALPREPVGGADWDRIEDPLERRVASLLAGEPVFAGNAALVPLHARVPSDAGHGRPADVLWAGERLLARFLVDDGRSYLRVVNRTKDALLVVAGTVFARGKLEVAAARDAVVPPDFAALVPAASLAHEGEEADLAPLGVLPPLATGSLLAGASAFDAAVLDARAIRGEMLYAPVLRSGVVVSRRAAIEAAAEEAIRGPWGTEVGAILLVGERPVAAHVFARHDLFLAALPDLLSSLAVAVRDEELRSGPPAARRRALGGPEVRSRALAWLRGIARVRGVWAESYGAGFETLLRSPTGPVVGHAVVDQQRVLVHAGFYAVPVGLPVAGTAAPVPPVGPPQGPDETPTGFRERRPRQTVGDERRGDQNPNPGPTPGGSAPGGAAPGGAAPGGAAPGGAAPGGASPPGGGGGSPGQPR